MNNFGNCCTGHCARDFISHIALYYRAIDLGIDFPTMAAKRQFQPINQLCSALEKDCINSDQLEDPLDKL